jgi:thiol:disulfide interchange protein DsbD
MAAAALLASAFAPAEDHPVTAELIVEHASVQPGGSTRIGIHFEMEEGWHIYAQDPGDAGLPTRIDWIGFEGVSFGPLQWPTPQEFMDPGEIKTHGYDGSVVLYSSLFVERQAIPERTIPLGAKVSWLACREICIPGSAQLKLELPVSTQTPLLSTHALFFDHAPEP